jgi:sulfur carrier protein
VDAITIIVNGNPRSFGTPLTIVSLLEQLGLGGRRVAVERNRAIVPRAHHADTLLSAGDRLELVSFVGGG